MIAPMVRIAVRKSRPDGFAIVHVFALRVFGRSQFAILNAAAHFARSRHIAVVFGIAILHACALDGFNQLYGLRHALRGQHLADHVFARLHAGNGKRRVLRGVIGKHDHVHIVFEKFIEIRVIGNALIAVFALRAAQTCLPAIANRHQLRVFRSFTVVEHHAPAPYADDADLQFLQFHSPPVFNSYLNLNIL